MVPAAVESTPIQSSVCGVGQAAPSQQGCRFIPQVAHWPWPCTQINRSRWPQAGQRAGWAVNASRESVDLSGLFAVI